MGIYDLLQRNRLIDPFFFKKSLSFEFVQVTYNATEKNPSILASKAIIAQKIYAC
jgi:hypothetical protein